MPPSGRDYSKIAANLIVLYSLLQLTSSLRICQCHCVGPLSCFYALFYFILFQFSANIAIGEYRFLIILVIIIKLYITFSLRFGGHFQVDLG